MSEDRATLDLRAEIARIDRDRAEARKLDLEARKIDEERLAAGGQRHDCRRRFGRGHRRPDETAQLGGAGGAA